MGATTTRLTFDEFEQLPQREGKLYELDERRLLISPSHTVQHNRIRDRIARRLSEFVEARNLGEIMIEVDFRLGPDTVRNPDVAFVGSDHLRLIDVERSPVEGAPVLAVEVISPANSAQDTARKIHQYLHSGCASVWIVYPSLRLIEIHSGTGVSKVEEPELLRDEKVFSGLSLSLHYIFDGLKE